MAQANTTKAPKRRTRKAKAAPAPAPVADDNTDAPIVDTDANDPVLQKQIEAEQEAKLLDLRSRLKDTFDNITTMDKESAIAARLEWVKVGDILKDGEGLFLKTDKEGNPTNETNQVKYGQWLKDQGMTALGQRPTRAAAKWLSDVYHTNPDLWALFPTESDGATALRRSPRTLKQWVYDNLTAAFNMTYADGEVDDEGNSMLQPVADYDDKDKKLVEASNSTPRVLEHMQAAATMAETALQDAQKAYTDAKKPADRSAAAKVVEEKADACDKVRLILDTLEAVNMSEVTSHFMNWKPKKQTVAFPDMEVKEAASYLMATFISKHDKSVDIVDELAAMVADMMANLAADAGDVVDDDAGDVADDAASDASDDTPDDSDLDDEDFDFD